MFESITGRLAGAVTLALALGTLAGPGQAQSPYTPRAVFCAKGDPSTPCSFLPPTVPPGTTQSGYQQLGPRTQTPFDNFGWQMFIALNWPADAQGNPLSGSIADHPGAPRVWQTYAKPQDVFKPAPPPVCPNPKGLPVLELVSKSARAGVLDGFRQAFVNAPLIDVNGNFTLYDRRMNPVEVKFIKDNKLDTEAGQKAYLAKNKTITFPMGTYKGNVPGPNGAIEIKAAWRILDAAKGDDPSRFYTMNALLEVGGSMTADGTNICQEVTVGLTGMHIMQKNAPATSLKPNWLWATLEHVDNAPTAANACAADDPACIATLANGCTPPARPPQRRMSYYNPDCKDCATNTPPKTHWTENGPVYLWNNTQPYAAHYLTKSGDGLYGTQATRCWKIYDSTAAINDQWRAALKGTVWANYQLIADQWNAIVDRPSKTDDGTAPRYVSNITMETYVQNNPSLGSCIGCHQGATVAFKDKSGNYPTTDFSFMPSLARAGLAR